MPKVGLSESDWKECLSSHLTIYPVNLIYLDVFTNPQQQALWQALHF